MRKLRDEEFGFDSRGRKKGNKFSVVLLFSFVLIVGITTLVNLHTPLAFTYPYSAQERNDINRLMSKTGTQEIHPYSPTRANPYGKSSFEWASRWKSILPGRSKGEVFFCERSHIRTDICCLHGDVRMDINTSSFVLYAADVNTPLRTEKIKPYTRKWEKFCMEKVNEITVECKLLEKSTASPSCDVHHHVPAVVFSTGGYTGNVYHEFHDGIIPLFVTTQHLKGQVIFIISEFHDWWMTKYGEIIRELSKYEILDFDNGNRTHCFQDVTVGMFIHEELGVDPKLMPNHETIQDFRDLLSRAYPKEEDNAATPGWDHLSMPRLVIIVREGSRVILNLDQVVELAERIGFSVALLKPDPTMELKRIYGILDSADVLVGVHGAALTHFLFMRPGSTFIQIIPLGTDWAARTYYGDPAKKLGLHYLDYKIMVEESSLVGKYDRTDPVLTNPNSVVKQGWDVTKEIYLEGQNVKLSLPRFYKILANARKQWKPRPHEPVEGNETHGTRATDQVKFTSSKHTGT